MRLLLFLFALHQCDSSEVDLEAQVSSLKQSMHLMSEQLGSCLETIEAVRQVENDHVTIHWMQQLVTRIEEKQRSLEKDVEEWRQRQRTAEQGIRELMKIAFTKASRKNAHPWKKRKIRTRKDVEDALMEMGEVIATILEENESGIRHTGKR